MQKHTQGHTQGHTQNQTDTHRTDDCGGIPCIVRAVRAGDDRLIGTLLQRFAQHAELDSLFRLRDALQLDADPDPHISPPACRAGR
ncbi:hypothetical protein [Streptomyces sp. NBC_01538]|uniref:hypothetical protein n=1 Tax=Streptomyces sp. NBC_01538 TaxID=2903897 RepID=UPI00386C075B